VCLSVSHGCGMNCFRSALSARTWRRQRQLSKRPPRNSRRAPREVATADARVCTGPGQRALRDQSQWHPASRAGCLRRFDCNRAGRAGRSAATLFRSEPRPIGGVDKSAAIVRLIDPPFKVFSSVRLERDNANAVRWCYVPRFRYGRMRAVSVWAAVRLAGGDGVSSGSSGDKSSMSNSRGFHLPFEGP
jgi:hypothetical protein